MSTACVLLPPTGRLLPYRWPAPEASADSEVHGRSAVSRKFSECESYPSRHRRNPTDSGTPRPPNWRLRNRVRACTRTTLIVRFTRIGQLWSTFTRFIVRFTRIGHTGTRSSTHISERILRLTQIAVRIPQAACYSPGPRRTRHPPADMASPQPSARILPTFPTDHAPTDTATSPENRQYRSQRQSTAPQSHASPAFCRERDVVDAFRRQRQSPLRTTESDFPTKVDHPSEPLRVTANDRHAIPPFPPSHATVPSPTSFRSTRSSSSMRNACFAINSSHWLMMSCAWASFESASCDSVADDCASSRIRS